MATGHFKVCFHLCDDVNPKKPPLTQSSNSRGATSSKERIERNMRYILPAFFIIFSFTGCETCDGCKKKKPEYTTVTAKVLEFDFKDPIIKRAKLTAYVETDRGNKFLEINRSCNKNRKWTWSAKRVRSAAFRLKIAKRERKKIKFKIPTSQLNSKTYFLCPDDIQLVE